MVSVFVFNLLILIHIVLSRAEPAADTSYSRMAAINVHQTMIIHNFFKWFATYSRPRMWRNEQWISMETHVPGARIVPCLEIILMNAQLGMHKSRCVLSWAPCAQSQACHCKTIAFHIHTMAFHTLKFKNFISTECNRRKTKIGLNIFCFDTCWIWKTSTPASDTISVFGERVLDCHTETHTLRHGDSPLCSPNYHIWLECKKHFILEILRKKKQSDRQMVVFRRAMNQMRG